VHNPLEQRKKVLLPYLYFAEQIFSINWMYDLQKCGIWFQDSQHNTEKFFTVIFIFWPITQTKVYLIFIKVYFKCSTKNSKKKTCFVHEKLSM